MKNYFHSTWKKEIKHLDRTMVICTCCPFLLHRQGVACSLGFNVRLVWGDECDFYCSDLCKLINVTWRIDE